MRLELTPEGIRPAGPPGARGRAGLALAPAGAPARRHAHAWPVHTLFAAVEGPPDRSLMGRARAFGAAVRRAADVAHQAVPARWRPGESDRLTGAAALVPVDRFAAYLEEAERAFAGDTPAELVSRVRNTYYSGFLVEQLIPDARSGGHTLRAGSRLGADARRYLTARADENGVGDNPAPYLLLPSGELVDFGHVVLGLDAMFHPRTSVPYSAYGVPNLDATGWVADVGMASVWTTKHIEGMPDPRASQPLAEPDPDLYYLMSAPDPDLLGDVDVFGLRATWALEAGQPLSAALRCYYLGRDGRPPGLRWRWRAFAAVHRLVWARDGGQVAWDPSWRTGWVRRIDRFNDVYGAGVGGSLLGTLTRPVHRAWPHTPRMLDRFLDWAGRQLAEELAVWG